MPVLYELPAFNMLCPFLFRMSLITILLMQAFQMSVPVLAEGKLYDELILYYHITLLNTVVIEINFDEISKDTLTKVSLIVFVYTDTVYNIQYTL